MITAIATATGLGPRVVKIGLIVLAVIVAIGAFYAILDAYGDAKHAEGKAEADLAWQQASDKLVQEKLETGKKADVAAAARAATYAAQVEIEKEKIDATIDDGTSPLDVLFPSTDRVR